MFQPGRLSPEALFKNAKPTKMSSDTGSMASPLVPEAPIQKLITPSQNELSYGHASRARSSIQKLQRMSYRGTCIASRPSSIPQSSVRMSCRRLLCHHRPATYRLHPRRRAACRPHCTATTALVHLSSPIVSVLFPFQSWTHHHHYQATFHMCRCRALSHCMKRQHVR